MSFTPRRSVTGTALLLHTCMLAVTLLGAVQLPNHTRAYRTAGDLPQFDSVTQDAVRWNPAAWSSMYFETVYEDGVARYGYALGQLGEQFTSRTQLLDCAEPLLVQFAYSTNFAGAGPGNNRNEVIVLTWDWAGSTGQPADRMAFTDVQYRQDANGLWEIVEADIYLNAQQFSWTYPPLVPTGAANERRIDYVVQHEMLHAFGILHPCEPDGVDGAPLCSASPSYVESAIYPEYQPAAPLTLSIDDLAAICHQFPAATCGTTCEAGSACTLSGCAALCAERTCPIGAQCVDGNCRLDCGTVQCAQGDTCVDGTCLAVCGYFDELVCQAGQFCEYSLGECQTIPTSCVVDTPNISCEARPCTDSAPCPSGMSCVAIIPEAPTFTYCVTSTGAVGDACGRDQDCLVQPSRCVDRLCRQNWAVVGDPCTVDAECASMLCADGACRAPCSDVNSCGGGASCAYEFPRPYCVRGRASYGEPCSRPADCDSGQCLLAAEPGSQGTCTRLCDDATPCPSPDVCRAVSGQPVCQPPPVRVEGGCTVASPRGRTRSPSLIATLAISLAAATFRRRRRISEVSL